jgi:YbbR domain-containing protein
MNIGRRLGIMFGALFVAVFLWSYVHLAQAYEADVDLPLLITAPHGLALAGGLPNRLHARIKGAGWQLIVMNFTKSSGFQIDLAERDLRNLANNRLTLHADDLAHSVVLPSEVKLLKVEPDSIELSFGAVTEKRVPIRVPVEVTPASGFAIVGMPRMTPGTIVVKGTREVLDSLTSFPTKPLSQNNAREDVIQKLELSDTLSNVLTIVNSGPVQVRLNVQAVAEQVFLDVPIQVDAAPPDKEVLLLPADLAVTLRGGVDQLGNLSPGKIHAHVKYDAIAFDTSRTIVPLIDAPAGTSFVQATPGRLRFVVRKRMGVKNAHP